MTKGKVVKSMEHTKAVKPILLKDRIPQQKHINGSVKKTLTELGKNIRRLRRSREMTQLELANKVECAKATIIRIEQGEMVATLSILVNVCRELEIRSIKILD